MTAAVPKRLTTDAGGGAFALPDLTIGIFLVDQPTHRFALARDRPALQPLSRHQGWILPAGAEGICEYDRAHEFLTVTLSAALLAEVGAKDPASLKPSVGDLDTTLLQLALTTEAAAGGARIYRETMQRALAAHLVYEHLAPIDPVAAIDDIRLRRAASHVHDNLAEDISLETLAAEAAMSPFHFARAFKAATGQSPLQYVIDARIELAQVLLRTTKLSIVEIAWRVGFGDASRFSAQFRKRVGTTPGRFRDG